MKAITNLLSKIFVPIVWTLFMQILFCIPGNNLPDSDWFNIPHFDKIIHIILFGCFVGFWCYYFYLKNIVAETLKKIFFFIFLLACTNGIVVEFIQLHFIANRSFDDGDIIADIIASGIGYGICNIKLVKTK